MVWPPSALRTKAKAPAKLKRVIGHPEEDAQAAIVQYLDLALPPGCGVFWSATMNGVKVHARTRAKLKRQGLRPGVLDIVFIALHGAHGLPVGQSWWIEVKSATGALSKEQRVILDALWEAGRGCVCRDPVQVCAALTAWDFPLRARL